MLGRALGISLLSVMMLTGCAAELTLGAAYPPDGGYPPDSSYPPEGPPAPPAAYYPPPAPPVAYIPPPPPRRAEYIPVAPSPRHVWTPGRWEWRQDRRQHVWAPGYWHRG